MKPLAIITLVRNEKFFLPRWVEYYSRINHAHLFVLDHESDDGSTSGLESLGVNVFCVHHPECERALWMLRTVQEFMRSLFASGFRRCIYAEVDEFLVADPKRWPNLDAFLEQNDSDQIGAMGWSVAHHAGDSPLPATGSMLVGRHWKRDDRYDMTLIASHVPNWKMGRHGLEDRPNNPDCGLRLVHLHYADPLLGWERLLSRRKDKPLAPDGMGWQNKVADYQEMCSTWGPFCEGGEPIPQEYWSVL